MGHKASPERLASPGAVGDGRKANPKQGGRVDVVHHALHPYPWPRMVSRIHRATRLLHLPRHPIHKPCALICVPFRSPFATDCPEEDVPLVSVLK